MCPVHRPRLQQGVTLIEVLVAVLIVSFGLLGLVGLQSRAVTYSVSAEDSNRAALLANEIATALKLNVVVTALSPAGLLNADSDEVKKALARSATQLPGPGTAAITEPGIGNVKTIVVRWKPNTAAVGATWNTYTTQVVVP